MSPTSLVPCLQPDRSSELAKLLAQRVLVLDGAQQLLVLADHLHPGVQFRRAVVAVHHRDEVSVIEIWVHEVPEHPLQSIAFEGPEDFSKPCVKQRRPTRNHYFRDDTPWQPCFFPKQGPEPRELRKFVFGQRSDHAIFQHWNRDLRGSLFSTTARDPETTCP